MRLTTKPLFLSWLVTVLFLAIPVSASEKTTDIVRVVAEAGTVQKVNNRSEETVSVFGMPLEHEDEVITEEAGRASILLSMLTDTDEMTMLPYSRIKFIKEVTHENRSVFRITLLYGKLKARSMKSDARQVMIDTDLVKVVSDEGEFVIRSNRQGTTVGTTAGMVRVIIKATDREIQLHQHSMVTVSGFASSYSIKDLDNAFLEGVEN